MAIVYETGVPTTQEDLLSKLSTFLVANGWTEDEWNTTTKRLCVHKGTVYIQFRWDAVASTGSIGVYHSLGYTGGDAPGTHPNDSGNGQTAANPITTARRMNAIGNSFVNYWFFLDSTYCHVVLEFSSGLYRHVSFGTINKIGTWTGGEYCSAEVWLTTGVSCYDIASFQNYSMFDGYGVSVSLYDVGTIHVEGLPNEGGASKWGVMATTTVASALLDRAGNARIVVPACGRDGPLGSALLGYGANPSNGFVPMYPVWVVYRYRTPTPEDHYFLGTIPGVRFINLQYLDPGEEFTYGAETWKVFPWVRKQNLSVSGNPESKNMGIAYQKA